jgi:PhzF family phenazine biosynthesis protein
MLEKDILTWQEGGRIDVQLFAGSANSKVEMYKREDGRAIVMLDIQPTTFRSVTLDTMNFVTFLGAKKDQFHMELPIELAIGDFTHLVVPISDLDAMRHIRPDFIGLKQFCLDHSFDTVVVFCREVVQSGYDVHLRDFCPAVGVAESAATGTTNAALTSYLIRHYLFRAESDKQLIILAEQGFEINRPSSIQSIVTMSDGTITRLQVGGVATKVLDGKLYIASGNSEDICQETETK